jgi:hypothetical protein
MDVVIISDEHGDHPEPAYNSMWSRIDSLRWNAGIIKARTKIEVTFSDTCHASGPGYDLKFPDLIGVKIRNGGRWSVGSVLDSQIDSYLRGIEIGGDYVHDTPEGTSNERD